jgi:hypothetical protein
MHFLYHSRSAPTGRILAAALGATHGTTPQASSTLIRWGNRAPSWTDTRRVLNHASAIGAASDKLGSLVTMREAGVRVPNFSTDPTELTFPFLGRARSHARGTDVVLCLQRGDYKRRPRDYYVQYIPTVREFRVHVAGGQVIRVQGKFLDHPTEAVPWIRNHAYGYRFRAPRKRLGGDRLAQAVLAVQSLGLDFGAVDLLIADDGLCYTLEVNTAPSCSPLTAGAYVSAFQRILNIPDEDIDLSHLNLLSRTAEDVDSDDEVEDNDGTAEEEHPVVA